MEGRSSRVGDGRRGPRVAWYRERAAVTDAVQSSIEALRSPEDWTEELGELRACQESLEGQRRAGRASGEGARRLRAKGPGVTAADSSGRL